MSIGDLDQRVTLKAYSQTNSGGEVEDTYTDQGTVWAEVISQRGSEAFEAARVDAQRIIRVRIRFRDDVRNQWTAIWDGQEYNITDTDRSQRRKGYLWFTAQNMEAT